LNGAQYYFRFRLSLRNQADGCTDTIPSFGPIVGGEVEDYRFSFSPLAVTLASFSAEATATGVTVSWETVSNLDTRGFNLYRSESDSGPWTQLNTVLIPVGTPLGSSDGGTYTYNDTTVVPGHIYWYMLEDESLSGVVTPHPPVSAAVPTAVHLVSLGAGPALGSAMPLAAIGFALLTGFALARRQRQ